MTELDLLLRLRRELAKYAPPLLAMPAGKSRPARGAKIYRHDAIFFMTHQQVAFDSNLWAASDYLTGLIIHQGVKGYGSEEEAKEAALKVLNKVPAKDYKAAVAKYPVINL